MFKSVLIIAPHPDDEVLGCGGLLSKLSKDGIKSLIIYATGDRERLAEAKKGLSILDKNTNLIDAKVMYPFLGNRLPSIAPVDMIDLIDGIVNEFKPELVLIPEPDSFNQDHRAISHATIAALRPNGATGKYFVPKVAIYEEISDEWSINQNNQNMDLYIPLDLDDVDRKCRAMQAHLSQDRPVPSERSTEAIKALSVVRGSQVAEKYAESYKIRRWKI